MNNSVGPLNLEDEEIKKYAEQLEREWGFSGKLLYTGCLEEMKRINSH